MRHISTRGRKENDKKITNDDKERSEKGCETQKCKNTSWFNKQYYKNTLLASDDRSKDK